jgi:diguanylate cyclase (GGDEF)-like protein/PAS domain S-box-containing protein
MNTTPLQRDDGPGWVVASFTDVTAQRELEAQLHAQWQRLRAALDSTRTAAWEWDVQTGVVRCDARWAEIIGLRPQDCERMGLQDCVALTHPDDVASSRDRMLRHFSGALEFYDTEVRMRHSSGQWRWVHSRGRVVQRSAVGRALLMVGTNEDVTERKNAELEAAAMHAMLQGLFDLAPVGISRVDLLTHEAMDFNTALCQMLGRSRDEMLRMADVSHRLGPEYMEARRRNLALALETGGYGPVEAELLHASGHRVDVVLSGARVFDPDGRPFVWSIVQDMTRYKRMEAELRAAAEQDPLTGLPNRNVLMTRLAQAQQRAASEPGWVFAVLFLDFDRFKLINDTLGHDAGDELLVLMAQRMRTVLCACHGGTGGTAMPAECGSFVARFGGDEFVVVAADIDGEREAMTIADRLHALLSAPYLVKEQVIQSGVSIGLAMGDTGASGPHALLRNADTAMYEAKRAGRGTTVVFDHAMHARLTRSMQIEAGLRLAVARAEFTVLYQPIVDLESGQMSSVEALLRWRHPELGTVSPVEFIPIAEESGQIVAIGEWVLRQACQQWVRWQREDAANAPRGMSVNLSRVQMLLGNQLLVVVRSVLADSGMPAAALQLEITEREVMKDPAAARELMLGLSAMGVRLAMDDFGTGTSSLGCLREYPFDTIKIDKSFVTDLGKDPHVLAVAHATVNVIENLGMVSVAEGIEDPAEVAMLQAMGCRYGQGYLFARPLSADQLLAKMAPGRTG